MSSTYTTPIKLYILTKWVNTYGIDMLKKSLLYRANSNA